MLERILIKQFAIIDRIEVDFSSPFTVITGETGAGKSIVIEAVAILLGDRSSVEMIRHGSEKAYIEGVLHCSSNHPIYTTLYESGMAVEGDESIVLSRELNVNGRNYCRVNGCTVSLAAYRQLVAGLLDIHGQHEYQQMMQSQKQLDIFDAYGGIPLSELRHKLKEAYDEWNYLDIKLTQEKANQQAILAKKDFLIFQLREIDDAGLSAGEEAELERELRRLTHSQRILKQLSQASGYLIRYETSESAYDLLSKALQQIKSLVKYDPGLEKVYDNLEQASYIMDEASREIDRYMDQLDVSPARLEEVENRLYKIKSLEKKYGNGTDGILKHRKSVAVELEEMEEFSLREEEWADSAAKAKNAYFAFSTELTSMRTLVKQRLEDQIDREFLDLAMEKAHFQAEIRNADPGPRGLEQVEFLISTNTGEPFLPLAKIASGGELSRITLAMKRILAASDACETLIFDEIDSGIGGITIQSVAEKLTSISREQQVICITHSPIIAAKADRHLMLEKEEQDGRTTTNIHELDKQERVLELTRMLGGGADSVDLRRHAEAMLVPRNN